MNVASFIQKSKCMKSTNKNMKHDWYRSFRLLMNKWNCHETCDIESSTEDPNYLCIHGVPPRINILVSNIRLQSQQLDIIIMHSSTFMPLYKITKTHCKREEYLNKNLSWNDITI
jgi:hypothetical protein